MDFISNLIKRPISLVLNEQSNDIDKHQISASLPTNSKEMENNKDSLVSANSNGEKHYPESKQNNNNNNQKPFLSMSSSYNGNHMMTDFIGVPDEYLDEFKDILPPPPLNLQNPDNLTPFDLDSTRCMSVTPPPPPIPPTQQQQQQQPAESEQTMTPSMKASQTIDELLSHISDNLQQAGLNDEVLALASPPTKGEISPISAKSSLNNSKVLTPSSSSASNVSFTKTPSTTAAGSANTTVFENNSSIHKFHIDPELENAIFDNDDHQQQQQDASKDHLNNSGVNKSCNKFVGLTEFDEAKIPELPGDLNPNIEEQYNVTFEECFIPTLTAQQGTTKVPDEFIVDKTHLLLPTETDANSSENETFADCNDDRDPLATTFAEVTNTLDVTTDLESYQSAANQSLSSNLNNTMENIADITMEAEGQPLKKLNQTQVVEQPQNENITQHYHQAMDEDEPMDIDMNVTMEIIQNTSSNIQHVEKVLQHAENILQDIEDKKNVEGEKEENLSGSMEKPKEQSTMSFTLKPQEENSSLEIEQSKHELSLNKSIELPVNNSKSISSECIIKDEQKEPPKEPPTVELSESSHQLNVTIDNMNSSTLSNSSVKSAESKTEIKLNSTLGLNTSVNSQKSSAPTSPSFPIKSSEITGFPRCPKSVAKPKGSPYLEKSDYIAKVEEINPNNNLNGTFVESSSSVNHLNGTFVEPAPQIKTNDKRLTYDVDNEMANSREQIEETEMKNKRQTFSIDPQKEEKTADEKRRTFSVKSNETPSSLMQFPSLDKPDNNRRTFAIDDKESMIQNPSLNSSNNDINSRRTFNVSTEELPPPTSTENAMDMSFEPMEVDDNISQNTTIPMPTEGEQRSQSPPLPTMQLRSQSPPLPTMQQRSQSPALTIMQQRSQSPALPRSQSPSVPTMQQRSQSPPLPTMQQRSQSPALPTLQQRSQSPTPQTMSQRSQSPALPTMQLRSQSPAVPTMQPNSQSPPLPTLQSRSQSPPLPTMQPRSQSPPLPTMKPRSQSPLLPNMQPRSQSPPLPTMQQNKLKNQLPTIPTAFDNINIKEEQISPSSLETTSSSTSYASQPLPTLIQKRPSIRDARARAAEILSAKEQSNIKVKDEKDVFVEKFTPSPIEDIFTAVSATSTTLTNSSGFSEFDQTSSSSMSIMNNGGEGDQQPSMSKSQQFEDEFSGNNNLILNPSDFDYLLTKGNNTTPVDRSSLLLKFDPLLGLPVPVNQGQQPLQQLQIPTNTINPCLSPTIEEDEHNDCNRSFVIDHNNQPANQPRVSSGGLNSLGLTATGVTGASAKLLKERSQEVKQQLQLEQQIQQNNKRPLTQGLNKKNATMSVDVIKDMSLDNDCNKTFENSNSTQSDDKQINYKMDELEKKIKNEVLKTEDIEKKLKDAEQREEALIKRITEKDKTVAKMTGVIEAYEKAIAELIADKEQLTQHYEKQLAEVKADRDSNYHHLTSLETTFSDLHVKYEKSKEMTCQLKESEEALQAEKRKNLENLHLQEQRYDKMKNHAMQQLEIANKKLESLTREHSIEITKLKALLKKEEIARSSINEQLAQKTKENAELVKICDELISGQGS